MVDQQYKSTNATFKCRYRLGFSCPPAFIQRGHKKRAHPTRLIATMLIPISANAGFNAFIDGHKLHDKSTAYRSGDIDNAELYDAGAYVDYVMGVVDATIRSGLFCPQNITSDQAANVISKYLNEHPDLWSSSAESLVKAALMKEWPCPK
ncbi:MAG: Rap1a/Tai family immunity protein [Methylococcaceae bacterium]|nr:Rap1a/Tai family immunity protein [Methylococcaceae bacterium]MDZ4156347.1 Rap1a/Tai family immunity protein [Methylococcales bacterium]MDP2394608.1 Rap1a/Tai family immunity protein [Methylococcaceae bacterium]MDP3019076.1 Rap1a/Tai family immunity protein [Methylococcaceae bacterium]MDP3390292.1 Rap1a/Tai family immunity protein [Methylococcaceae bacterium]